MTVRVVVTVVLLGLIIVLGAIILVVYPHELPVTVDLFVGGVTVAAGWVLWLLLRLQDRQD